MIRVMIRAAAAAALASALLASGLAGGAAAQGDPCAPHERAVEFLDREIERWDPATNDSPLADRLHRAKQAERTAAQTALERCLDDYAHYYTDMAAAEAERARTSEHQEKVRARDAAARAYINNTNPTDPQDSAEVEESRQAYQDAREDLKDFEDANPVEPVNDTNGLSNYYIYHCIDENPWTGDRQVRGTNLGPPTCGLP